MGEKNRKVERTTFKLEKAIYERIKNLKGEKTVSEFLNEALDFYEKKDTLVEKGKEEKKLTPYGPVIKRLIKEWNLDRYSTAYSLGVHPDNLPLVESGEKELTLMQLRGFANNNNIYDIALEKGLVIPLPREFWR